MSSCAPVEQTAVLPSEVAALVCDLLLVLFCLGRLCVDRARASVRVSIMLVIFCLTRLCVDGCMCRHADMRDRIGRWVLV